MNKILPFTKPEISHLPADTYLMAILDSYPQATSWMVNNLVNIYIAKFLELDGFARTTEFFNCPYFTISGLTYDFIDNMKCDIVEYLEFALNNNFYIYIAVNRQDMKAYKGTDAETHNLIVYGYDSEKREFYLGDFFPYKDMPGGKFGCYSCSYDEMHNGYYGVDEFEGFRKNSNVMLLRYRDEYTFVVSIAELIHSIEQFMSCENIFRNMAGENINFNFNSISIIEKGDFFFGADSFDLIAQQIKDIEFNRFRPLGLIKDMSTLWLRRLNYLIDNNYILRKQDILLGQIQNIAKILQTALNLFTKVTISSNKELVMPSRDRVSNMIMDCKELFKQFLNELLIELKYYQYTTGDFS